MTVTLIGAGMGTWQGMTNEAQEAVQAATMIFGAKRLLDIVSEHTDAKLMDEYRASQIVYYLKEHPTEQAVVLFSGDLGFYSGSTALIEALNDVENCKVKLLCGISCVQMFASRIRKDWQGVHLASVHGRDLLVLPEILSHSETCFLTGGHWTPRKICQELVRFDCGNFPVWIGERLSYPEERILQGKASDFFTTDTDPLAVLWVENLYYTPRKLLTGGLPDESFLRAEIPMTKREVRSMAMSLLELKESDTCYYDIGAGTGSVSAELSLLTGKFVYAVEHHQNACDLIRQNQEHLGARSVRVIYGHAPEALSALPAPDAVFLGGTDGDLSAIVSAVLQKNPSARFVASAILPQTAVEAAKVFRDASLDSVQMTQVQISHSRFTSRGDLMLAQNPIYLISGRGREACP